MRAREFLFEDSRSTIQKLEELIAHPSTEENVRKVAQGRLDILLSQQPIPAPPAPPRITVKTNVAEADLDQPFVRGVPLGDLYDNLIGLSPSPCDIAFGRQGIIQMKVAPPFMGKTKQQYVNELYQACPGARDVRGHMIESPYGGSNYIFTISFI